MAAQERKRLIVRIDNVRAIDGPSAITGTHQLLDVAESLSIPVVVGITPLWQTDRTKTATTDPRAEGYDTIRERIRRHHAVALHGLIHKCILLLDEDHSIERTPTIHEFSCRDLIARTGHDIPITVQAEWLERGQRLLHDVVGVTACDILVPPAHCFGDNTLNAMAEVGMKYVSCYDRWANDAWTGVAERTILPSEFEDYARLAIRLGVGYEAVVQLAKAVIENGGSLLQLFFHAQYNPTDQRIPEAAISATAEILEYAVRKGYAPIVPADIGAPV